MPSTEINERLGTNMRVFTSKHLTLRAQIWQTIRAVMLGSRSIPKSRSEKFNQVAADSRECRMGGDGRWGPNTGCQIKEQWMPGM